MTGELKDQRIITLMTPTEVETIDEWSFAHRIRSRGEAIRRLCQIGIASASAADTIGSQASAQAALLDSLSNALVTTSTSAPVDAENAIKLASEVYRHAASLSLEVVGLLYAQDKWAQEGAIDELSAAAKKFDETVAALRARNAGNDEPLKKILQRAREIGDEEA